MSTGPLWIVPFEGVRASVSTEGAVTLAQLAARHAEFLPHATVELAAPGFIADVQYRLPGYVQRVEHAHVVLAWVASENRIEGPAC